jgi:hypothetical protein
VSYRMSIGWIKIACPWNRNSHSMSIHVLQ